MKSKNTLAYIVCTYLTLMFLAGCGGLKKTMSREIDSTLDTNFFDNHFAGILIVDAQTNDTLYNRSSTKYFTPASNTKIFTLYAALKLLPAKIPALKYIERGDTTYIAGTGDPTLVHSHFKDETALDFLKDKKNIGLYLNNFQDTKLGPGWSWDDYHYYYQPERGSLPLYGNVLTLYNVPNKKTTPSYFKDSIVDLDNRINRELDRNKFYYSSKRKDTLEVPLLTDSLLTKKLLEIALQKKVTIIGGMPSGKKNVIYSVNTDSVLKRMMQESDNFLAEQLLILASSMLSDTLSSHTTMKFVLDSLLPNLKQKPRWVDGSGLSRYNLFSPESMVDVLYRMYMEIPQERLFDFFPAGGVSGTLKDWYPGNPDPYIFAKTGSLGNNHNLSGYLKTHSGKTLIFSFMNNHFRHPTSDVKIQMQKIFETIRDTY